MTSNKKNITAKEIAIRFNELAQQEKWFEIQDEFFSDTVTSRDPRDSPYLGYAEGKVAVHKKGKDFVKEITAVHKAYTSEPVVGGNYFSVAREIDITHQKFGRMQINQIMLYEVKDG